MIPILYIDEEVDSEAMSSKFEVMAEYDITVRRVADVADAIPALRSQRDLALVVLDIIMPPGNYSLGETNGGTKTGLRLLEDIRQEFPNMLVMIVSVMPREKAEDAIRQYSVIDYVTKPVSGSELAAAIGRVLGIKK
jgi:CheY-like chemotaxis protein